MPYNHRCSGYLPPASNLGSSTVYYCTSVLPVYLQLIWPCGAYPALSVVAMTISFGGPTLSEEQRDESLGRLSWLQLLPEYGGAQGLAFCLLLRNGKSKWLGSWPYKNEVEEKRGVRDQDPSRVVAGGGAT